MPSFSVPQLSHVREQFASLHKGEVFMDNAGGSQVPTSVADAVRDFMLTSYVQLGGDYPASRRATESVEAAHNMANLLVGGTEAGHTFLGHSSSSACRMLTDCYAEVLQLGDEIVVAENGHEANIGPWMNLANQGFTVKLWRADRETGECDLTGLQALLTERTKIVAMVHVSNILGHVVDIKPCIEAAHAVGAKVVLDGVAYAPHLSIDVREWEVDWYVFSSYKVFGPHMSVLFGTHEAISQLTGPNHFFLPKDYLPGKFELGGPSYEACAALLGLSPYLQFLAGANKLDRSSVVDAWRVMEHFEKLLTDQLLGYLATKSSVRIIGRKEAGPGRLPTVSFLHHVLSPQEIAGRALEAGIGIKEGNFYAVRLLERMGIDPNIGVTRVSLAHYNTPEEVDRLIRALDPVL